MGNRMIQIVKIEVDYFDKELKSFQTIEQANAYLSTRPGRYEYTVYWADNTTHKGRSSTPDITATLKRWKENFTNGPIDASVEEKTAFITKVRSDSPRLLDHAARLATELNLE
jgi:hypothetical protein